MIINKEEYRRFINKFSHLNILVIGDIMLDKYIQGQVNRISPEAPVPVVKVQRKENRIGGAGNVAANLASLHCHVTLASICGNDEAGRTILSDLDKQNIRAVIPLSDTRPTTVKTRIIAQHQQVVRVDEEKDEPFTQETQNLLMEKLLHSRDKYDGIILSDYNKGLLNYDFIQSVRKNFKNLPVIIDPKGVDYAKYASATAIKPNWKEFKQALNKPCLGFNAIQENAAAMVKELQLQGIIITLGEKGVFVLDDHNQSRILPTVARDVFDVSGAGDTFIAAFTAGLLSSGSWLKAATLANIASGIVVGKVGTAVVHNKEILDSLNLYD